MDRRRVIQVPPFLNFVETEDKKVSIVSHSLHEYFKRCGGQGRILCFLAQHTLQYFHILECETSAKLVANQWPLLGDLES